MPRFQFSLRWLLGLTTFVAVGCAALLNANEFWSTLLLNAVLFLLVVAVLLGIFRRGTGRAFWVGFAIFGWMYLWLATEPISPPNNSGAIAGRRFPQEGYTSPLATTKLICFVYGDLLPKLRELPPPPSNFPLPGLPANAWLPATYPDWENFLTVGHALWALVLAWIGGQVARWFYVAHQRTG